MIERLSDQAADVSLPRLLKADLAYGQVLARAER
jgi:hypothetical protein